MAKYKVGDQFKTIGRGKMIREVIFVGASYYMVKCIQNEDGDTSSVLGQEQPYLIEPFDTDPSQQLYTPPESVTLYAVSYRLKEKLDVYYSLYSSKAMAESALKSPWFQPCTDLVVFPVTYTAESK